MKVVGQIALAALAASACAAATPAVRSTPSADLFYQASNDVIHLSGWEPCDPNRRMFGALERADERLDALKPWIRQEAGEERFQRMQDELGMERGTFDPLCPAAGLDLRPPLRRVNAMIDELERRARPRRRN